MNTNTLVKKAIQGWQVRHDINFVEKIDELIELGGRNCHHIVSGGYIYSARFDGQDECIAEAHIVEDDDNQCHIGCRDSSSFHQITGGTFLVTWYSHQNNVGNWVGGLSEVFVTSDADLDQVARIIEAGSDTDWKKL